VGLGLSWCGPGVLPGAGALATYRLWGTRVPSPAASRRPGVPPDNPYIEEFLMLSRTFSKVVALAPAPTAHDLPGDAPLGGENEAYSAGKMILSGTNRALAALNGAQADTNRMLAGTNGAHMGTIKAFVRGLQLFSFYLCHVMFITDAHAQCLLYGYGNAAIPDCNRKVNAMVTLPPGVQYAGDVIVGGNFGTVGTVSARSIARYSPGTNS
jgi:hypothetical protein